MMGEMDANQNRALQFIQSVHERLAAFVRDSYAAVGRGAVVVQAPDIPPGVSAIASTAMVYHSEDEIRTLTRGLPGQAPTMRLFSFE